MVKRILVGLGGTDYTIAAINYAVALASQHKATLTGISVIDERRLTSVGPVPIGGGTYARELAEDRLEKARQRINNSIKLFTEACVASDLVYHVRREVGEPFALMIDQARYHDLMIFGLRSLFECDIVPDPHDALIRLVQSGVRPLLAVPKGFEPVNKVLISYSGSMESAKAMKRFIEMNLWPDAKLRIVTFDHAPDAARQLLDNAADYCEAHGYEVETDHVPGSPRDQLLPYADQWGAGLIVVGNSAKNLLLRRIFGETALHAIQNADRPLFLAQ
jgi:nucleotide-binding universal stress UspA family protein